MMALAKVLVIDEEHEFYAVLTRRLAKRNFTVTFAHSEKAALSRLEEDKDIEVVILDVTGPDLDGIEILKRIKKKKPLVEAIVLTGDSAIDSAISAIKIGAFDYLLKPVEIKQLVSKIEKAAGRKRHRDKLLLEVYMTPYLTRGERAKRIADILGPQAKTP
jgi:DNA-binding NtrC family response regulator